MNVVVLVKPVRDAQIPDGWAIGSLDLYALSHALELRDSVGGTVHVLAVGPVEAASVVQRALASGADEATHVQIGNITELDALTVSRVIQGVLANFEVDLVLCGQASDDIETGVVGAMVAELLSLPHVSTVTSIAVDGERLRVERDIVGGRQVLSVDMPAVLVVLSGRTIPLRYPTPRGMIAARKKPSHSRDDIQPVAANGISWTEARLPERLGDGEIVRDVTAQEAATRIADWLRERGLTG